MLDCQNLGIDNATCEIYFKEQSELVDPTDSVEVLRMVYGIDIDNDLPEVRNEL